jgi:2-dehydro-3-deoxyphosphogluconate aldolase / (4S)-4-hydroxy-2-oxoglutarate aldolase
VTEITARLTGIGIVPVIVLDDPADARPLGNALADAGLPCAEVTFRTARAAEALTVMAEDSRLLVGAGTVLTPEQVDAAIGAGATYIVTPGYSHDVVRACQDRGVPVIPGVATPTEIQMALADGVTLVKFFPAEAVGGTRALSAVAAPFPMVRFIPTGGISPENLADYLALPSVAAVGGSWMVSPGLLSGRRWGDVTRLAADAVATVARHRPRLGRLANVDGLLIGRQGVHRCRLAPEPIWRDIGNHDRRQYGQGRAAPDHYPEVWPEIGSEVQHLLQLPKGLVVDLQRGPGNWSPVRPAFVLL